MKSSVRTGVLRLAPSWVGRTILLPGKRLKLDCRDLYPFGASFGAQTERWMASTGMADNGPTTTENEGMSYMVVKGAAGLEKILFKDAIDAAGDLILGQRIMDAFGGLTAFAKFYDFQTPIGHHVHLRKKQAGSSGCHTKT